MKHTSIFTISIVVAIVLLSGALYWNTLTHEFVNFDDQDLVVRNRYIRALSIENIKAIFTPGVVGAYQPVRTLSYALDYHFWKLNPTGYHLTNVLLQMLNTLLVFLLASALNRKIGTAFLAALIFAVHPIHVEAVAWVAGRRDVLSVAFTLTAFWCYLKMYPPTGREAGVPNPETPRLCWRNVVLYVLALLCFALGLLSKPSVVIFPVLLVAYDWCFQKLSFRNGKKLLAYVPFFVIAFGFTRLFVALSQSINVAKSGYHGGSAYTTFLTMLRVFAEYLFMFVAPRNLSVTYGIRSISSIIEPVFLMALVTLILTVGLTVLAWKRHARLVVFGISWVFISLLPVSNLIPIAVIKADRYLYLPSIGWGLAAAWLIVWGSEKLAELLSQRPGRNAMMLGYWAVIALTLGSYTLMTVQRNQDWQNSHTLWTATLETTPNSTIALNNLGMIYSRQGMYEKAIALYEQLLDYDPNQEHVERVYVNLARAYAGLEMYEKAHEYCQLALETDPRYVEAYLVLGSITAELHQYEKAEQIYTYAQELAPENEMVYTRIGNIRAVQGDFAGAIAQYRKALELNPFYLEAYNSLGISYAESGHPEDALAIYQQALSIDPDSALIRSSLGTLYMNLGQTEQAIQEFERSLDADPANAEVWNNLGILRLRTERYKEAMQAFMTALHYDRDHPQIMSNLGLTYARVGLFEEAIQMYQWALQIDPSLGRTAIALGDVCFMTEDYACAAAAYQKALDVQAGDAEVLQKKLDEAQRRLSE